MTEQALTDRLQSLLESERDALLSGDFDRLSDLMQEKQSLANALADRPLEAEEIAPLRDGLRRNQDQECRGPAWRSEQGAPRDGHL
jgi:hypothetical protein